MSVINSLSPLNYPTPEEIRVWVSEWRVFNGLTSDYRPFPNLLLELSAFIIHRTLEFRLPRELNYDDAILAELTDAAVAMTESLPIYSPSSAAYERRGRLDQAIRRANQRLRK